MTFLKSNKASFFHFPLSVGFGSHSASGASPCCFGWKHSRLPRAPVSLDPFLLPPEDLDGTGWRALDRGALAELQPPNWTVQFTLLIRIIDD